MLARGEPAFLEPAADVVVARGGHLDDVHDEGQLAQPFHRDAAQPASALVLRAEGLEHLGRARHLQSGERVEGDVVVVDRQAHVAVLPQRPELQAALTDDPESPLGVDVLDGCVAHDPGPRRGQCADLVASEELLDLGDQLALGHAHLVGLLVEPAVRRRLPVDCASIHGSSPFGVGVRAARCPPHQHRSGQCACGLIGGAAPPFLGAPVRRGRGVKGGGAAPPFLGALSGPPWSRRAGRRGWTSAPGCADRSVRRGASDSGAVPTYPGAPAQPGARPGTSAP